MKKNYLNKRKRITKSHKLMKLNLLSFAMKLLDCIQLQYRLQNETKYSPKWIMVFVKIELIVLLLLMINLTQLFLTG